MSTRDAETIRLGIVDARRTDRWAQTLWYADARRQLSRRRFRLYARAFWRAGA